MADRVGALGTAARRLLLDGDDWQLTFRARVDAPAACLDEALAAGYATIPARVPGSIELDLERAGLIDDPYVGANIEQLRHYDYGDWWYRTSFELPAGWDPSRTSLVLHGLDTIGEVHLNGVHLGSPRNMLIAHELDAGAAAIAGENVLEIHIESPLRHAERYDYPAWSSQIWNESAALHVRKPGHMYGWDIAPRLISAGLHRSVELVERAPRALTTWSIRTKSLAADHSAAELDVHYVLSAAPRGADWTLRVEGRHEASGSRFSGVARPGFLSGRMRVTVDAPRLWYPRNYGDPDLYDVTLSLTVDGEVVDEHRTTVGIRTIDFDYELAPAPAGRFAFAINGTPITVLGTNWVPIDAIHARDAERLPRALEALRDSGCNLVRCWGGNLYEDSAFFDWCDRNGMLVWQDFALACARYPQDDAFADAVADEVESIVLALRNHPSLVLWCGSNENDDSYAEEGVDPDTDRLTREVIPRVLRAHDWDRPYIVGSPAYTGAMVADGTTAQAPEQHLWGDRASFTAPFYTRTAARFVSEIGFHGSPSSASLDRFIPAEHAAFDPDDPVWILHESDARLDPTWRYSRLDLMARQAELMFPGVDRTARGEFIPASQISQAEALKFWIEDARLRGRSGIIWWNLLDCWPQISDAVIDYYFDRKLAFEYARRSQAAVCLVADDAQGWQRDFVLLNDSSWSGSVPYTITSARNPGVRIEGVVESTAGGRVVVARREIAPAGECYLMTWTVDGVPFGNHYREPGAGESVADYLELVRSHLAGLDSAFSWEAR